MSNLTSPRETIKIVDSGGYSVSLNDDWGNGQGRKAWAVEANSSGYLLTIKSTDNWGYGDVINWEVYQLSVQTDNGVTTAIYDWSPIYSSEDISSYETIFAQDLNEDGNANSVLFMPAFTGLGAPYWNSEARGIISGLTRNTGYQDIVRAALESVVYQSIDLFNAIKNDGLKPKLIKMGSKL